MTKVKNVRAGIVIIADAKIKLAPGESVELEKLTRQAQKAVDDGLLACIDTTPAAKPEAKQETKPEGKPEAKAENKPKGKAAAPAVEGKEASKKGKGQPAEEKQPQAPEENSEQKPEDQSGQGQLIEAGDAPK